MKSYLPIVKPIIEATDLANWLELVDIIYVNPLERNPDGKIITYTIGIEDHNHRYSACILDTINTEIWPIPNTVIGKFCCPSEAAATCMIFEDAVATVRAYDSKIDASFKANAAMKVYSEYKQNQDAKVIDPFDARPWLKYRNGVEWVLPEDQRNDKMKRKIAGGR